MNERLKHRSLPLADKANFIKKMLFREKTQRIKQLTGEARREKIEEIEIALDCIDAIDAHFKQAGQL
jgi:hypothetical protein